MPPSSPSPVVDVDALARREGFTVLDQLKQDYDNDVYLVEHDGEQRILKTVKQEELVKNLDREVAYAMLVASLALSQPDWTMRTSVPRLMGRGWMLRDKVDAEPLIAEDDPGRTDPIERVGRALADLDRLAPDPAGTPVAYRDPAGEPVKDVAHRMSEFASWMDELSGGDALGDLEPQRLLGRLEESRSRVQPGLEVWDTKFDDFLDLPDGKVGLYDLEFAHLWGRRYYDLGKIYGTLAVPFAVPDGARHLLSAFVDHAMVRRDQLAAACLPVLAECLLSQLKDAADVDDDASDDERKQAAEQTERARELLVSALDGDLDALCA